VDPGSGDPERQKRVVEDPHDEKQSEPAQAQDHAPAEGREAVQFMCYFSVNQQNEMSPLH
jgi:hypothetical protein